MAGCRLRPETASSSTSRRRYALDLEALRNAEHGFDGARYIHLVRDPLAMARSFESYHMDQILLLDEHPWSGRTLGELVWTLSHRNILQFAQEVPAERLLRVHFEDLVSDPRATMTAIASFLELEFEESLVQPYQNLEAKMVDGLHPESTPMGDTRLLERNRIDPAVARRAAPAEAALLGDPTVRLALAAWPRSREAETPRLRAAGTSPLRRERAGRRGDPVADGFREEVVIVGMAGRFPGAATSTSSGPTCATGVESIRPFSDEELAPPGSTAEAVALGRYVRRAAALMDSRRGSTRTFFGIRARGRPRLMDPQHRVMLECAWSALEHAGYVPGAYPGVVGVFGGVGAEQLLPEQPGDPSASAREAGPLRDAHRQRARVRDDADRIQARPHRTGDQRQHRVLDLGGGAPPGLPEPPRRRVRHGAGRRRRRARPADGRLPLPGGRHPLARRPLPRVRRRGARHGRRQRRRDRRRQAARGRRRATATPSTPSIKGTAINNDGAEKIGFTAPGVRGQEAVDPRGAATGGGRRRRRSATSRRTARARSSAIPIEVAGAHQGVSPRHRRRRLLPDRVGQDQHRPPRRGRRRGGSHQGGAGAASTDRFPPASTSRRRIPRSTSPRARSVSATV